MIDPLYIFGLQLTFSIVVWSLLAKWIAAPKLKQLPFNEVLFWLILPHAFRHIGMVFLVPGIVSESIPANFPIPTAYGDLLSAVLALIILSLIKSDKLKTYALVGIFNLIGTVDLLLALSHPEAVPYLNASWFIPTFFVPLLLVTHFMIFVRLLRNSA